jgi:hypothetical protein
VHAAAVCVAQLLGHDCPAQAHTGEACVLAEGAGLDGDLVSTCGCMIKRKITLLGSVWRVSLHKCDRGTAAASMAPILTCVSTNSRHVLVTGSPVGQAVLLQELPGQQATQSQQMLRYCTVANASICSAVNVLATTASNSECTAPTQPGAYPQSRRWSWGSPGW